jgi:nitrate/nitrite transporter NarK
MCRPSCCKQSNEGAGIAAVAAIAAGAVVAVKIGPVVARIIHLVIEVLTIIMLTAVTALVCIVLAWLTMRIVRWRLRRRSAHPQMTLRPVPAAASDHIRQADTEPGCLAYGDTGTVLRTIGGSPYQLQWCPVCKPVTRAG